jgi:hypothetical protein
LNAFGRSATSAFFVLGEMFGIQARKVSGGEKMLSTVADAQINGIKFAHKLSQNDRITQAFGSADRIPRVHAESLSRYYKHLTEHLSFPFIAHFPKPATSREEEEFRCTVLELIAPAKHQDDRIDGIFCKIRKGPNESNLPLIDLYLPEDCFSFQWIDDYWYWFWNWQ